MGQASYSLYLLHLPILTAGIKIASMVIKNNWAFSHLYVAILIIGICYLSILFFNYLEKPVIDKLSKLLTNK